MSQQPLSTQTVTVNGITIDPNGPKRSRDCQNTNYIYLVPVPEADPDSATPSFTIDQLQRLEDLGAHIYEREGEVYLCRYEPVDLAPLRNLDFVSVANCYHKDFKIPTLTRNIVDDNARSVGPLSDEGARPPGVTLNLILHSAGSDNAADQVAVDLRNIPGVDVESIQITPGLVTTLEEVRTVAPEVPATVFNNVATVDMHAKSLALPDSLYRGRGQVVSINDTGFDLGSTEDVHPDFRGRVCAVIPFSGAPSGEDIDGHGTHVAGSVLGSGTSATMGGRIEGTAPEAELVMNRILYAPKDFRPGNSYIPLLQGAYNNYNSRISCNSWGQTSPYQISYNESSRASSLDQFIWDHQDQIVCVAAGNSGEVTIPSAQISDGAAAKNCITVGCTYSSRPAIAFNYDTSSLVPSDPTMIAEFSSRGPTVEGRIKPDVTAPGVAILSTCSRSGAVPKEKKEKRGISTDPLYMFDSGTSMAAPLVAGCCAVLRQMLDANGYPEPSAALVKALLINGALANGELHDDRSKASVKPSPTFGFGRVDLEHAMVLPLAPEDGGMIDEKAGIKAGEIWMRMTQPITTEKRTIKITLVWTDPPGRDIQHPLTLELRVNHPTSPQLYIPVVKASQSQGVVNNVQQIIYHDLGVGRRWAVTVQAGTFTPVASIQPFAVVWSISS